MIIKGGLCSYRNCNDEAMAMVIGTVINPLPYMQSTGLNYFSEYGRKVVELLIEQASVLINCVDEKGELRFQTRVPNTLASDAREYQEEAEKYDPWKPHVYKDLITELIEWLGESIIKECAKRWFNLKKC